MARPGGNRGMWLLKITSKHHTPERLAWAVALGVLVGLVPKLNLLAVGLYALIVFLPVHTLLAVLISLVVTVGSFYLDPVTDRLGELLLTQSMFAWLWNTLDEAPLVPWLGLNNTVVLGSLVIGLMAIAPGYMFSLRLFEYLEYDLGRLGTEHNYSSVPTEETPLVAPPSIDMPQRHKHDKLKFTPQRPDENERRIERRVDRHTVAVPGQSHLGESEIDVTPVIIPPPKLAQRSARADKEAAPVVSLDEPIEFEPIEFEPIDEVKSIINSWHMGQASGQRPKVDALVTGPQPQAQVARPTPIQDQPRISADNIAVSISDAPPLSTSGEAGPTGSGMFDRYQSGTTHLGLGHDLYPESTWRGDVMTTLEVIQNAGETLAWVDELLDECLENHGITVMSADMHHDWDRPARSSQSDSSVGDTIVDQGSESGGQSASRWLMETTIEIVRWTDDVPAHNYPDLSPGGNESDSQSSFGKGASDVMQPSHMTRDAAANSGAAELTILPINGSPKRQAEANNSAGFQHLVMAGASKPDGQVHASIEPVKGECLGYLLGHLRQAREGKSS